MSSIYEFDFKTLKDEPLRLRDYAGRVLLIVNTASHCGFTKQYTALEALYQTYKDAGLTVIGVPSRDFGAQEFESACDIQAFLRDKYPVTFPMTALTTVKGDTAHPFYHWASEHAGVLGTPKWNFHKYLISRSGQFVDWFSSLTAPDADKLVHAIQQQLNDPVPV